jgi:nifR3 family TIM-barrel protein
MPPDFSDCLLNSKNGKAPHLFLAPVAGYSTRAFRSICAGMGSEMEFTELVSSEAVVRSSKKVLTANNAKSANPYYVIPEQTARLLRRGDAEKRFAVQLFGSNPDTLYKAVEIIAHADIVSMDLLDLNAGCPIPKVTKTGAGSALMREPGNLAACTAALVRASRDFLGGVPVSVKMRSGWDFSSINYLECAEAAISAGARMLTLHPRTKTQVYSGKADWSHLRRLVEFTQDMEGGGIPVCGSGDLFAPEDALRMHAETGCHAVMFARGAFGNPFIFRETRELITTGKWTPPDATERIATAFRELELLAADLGEKSACLEMRKTFCAYTKGLHGSARLREQIVHASTIEEYHNLTAETHEFL